ncbi:MAG: OmpA family protein [Pseudomonadota bacterium]
MKNFTQHSVMTMLAAVIGLSASLACAQTNPTRVYVTDSRGEVLKSGANLCWRTGYWTPAAAANDAAACACDKDLMPKEQCEPKATPVSKPEPVATPYSKPAAQKISLAADTLFDFDKATLRKEGMSKLDELMTGIKDIKLEVIIAVGYADRLGSAAYNQKLSEKRAASVKAYLVSKGIDAAYVHTEGKGEQQPVTKPGECKGKKSKKVIACLQADRRVEIEIIGTK